MVTPLSMGGKANLRRAREGLGEGTKAKQKDTISDCLGSANTDYDPRR